MNGNWQSEFRREWEWCGKKPGNWMGKGMMVRNDGTRNPFPLTSTARRIAMPSRYGTVVYVRPSEDPRRHTWLLDDARLSCDSDCQGMQLPSPGPAAAPELFAPWCCTERRLRCHRFAARLLQLSVLVLRYVQYQFPKATEGAERCCTSRLPSFSTSTSLSRPPKGSPLATCAW